MSAEQGIYSQLSKERQDTVVETVAHQIESYAEQYGSWWTDDKSKTKDTNTELAKTFGVMMLSNYLEINRKAITGEDSANFRKLFENGGSAYTDFFENFFRDISGIIGVPFPSTDGEVKLSVITTSQEGLSVWIQNERENQK